ncbi:hypothetical protein MMPV_007416 [Pyropia vietnamensis]
MSQVLAANPATNKRPFDSMMSIDGVPSPATAPCTPHRIHFLAPPAGKRYRPGAGGAGGVTTGFARTAAYTRPSSSGASSSDDTPAAVGRGPAGGGDLAAVRAGRRYLSGARRLRRPPGAMQESDGSSSDTSSTAAAAAAKAGVDGAGTAAGATRGGHPGVTEGNKAVSAAATTVVAPAVPSATPRGTAGSVATGAGQVVLPEPPRGTVWMPVAKRLRKAVTAAMGAGERLYTSAEVSAAVAQAVATAEADVRSQAEMIMSERLAEQWHSFNRFNQDAVARQYAGKELSYLS